MQEAVQASASVIELQLHAAAKLSPHLPKNREIQQSNSRAYTMAIDQKI
jgi:hypothetical protein